MADSTRPETEEPPSSPARDASNTEDEVSLLKDLEKLNVSDDVSKKSSKPVGKNTTGKKSPLESWADLDEAIESIPGSETPSKMAERLLDVSTPVPTLEKPGTATTGDNDLPFNGEHILEIYGLTKAVKTRELEAFAGQYCPQGALRPAVRWAKNGTSAVASFVDPSQAREFLAKTSKTPYTGVRPSFSVRKFMYASKAVFDMPLCDLLPPKARPKTTTAVARRLIASALQNRDIRDMNAERELRDARLENKARRDKERQAKLEQPREVAVVASPES